MEENKVLTADERIAQSEHLTALKKSNRRRAIRRNLIGTVMAAPPFIGFLCFTLFPMLVSGYVSFTYLPSLNINMAKWIGVDNYVRIFQDEKVWEALGNTLEYCLSVPLNLAMAVLFANAISKKLVGGKFYRVILFLPQVCSTIAVTLMWQWIFNEFGMLNTFFENVGWEKVGFLTDEKYFMIALITISVWKNGTNIVILEAAFANVNKTLQEAAQLDGANNMQLFWRITLPQLTPTIFYLLTMLLLGALQEQALMQILAGTINGGEGPGGKAVTLVYYIYRMAYNYPIAMGMGMSCALSWLTAIFILLVTRLNFWLSKFWVSYD